MRLFRVAVAAMVWGGLLWSPAVSAQVSDSDARDLGRGLQALSIFNATPGISAASFYVGNDIGDDATINSYKFAPSHTFDPVYGIKPYVEGTAGYLDYSFEDDFPNGLGQNNHVKLDYNTISFLAGVGVEVDVFEGTVIRPIFLAGYSRIWDGSSVSGPNANEIRRNGDGLLFDAWLNTALVGGAIEVEHEGHFDPQSDINYTANIRYDQFYANTVSASNSAMEGSSTFGIMTALAEFDGPVWGVSLFDRELRWIGFATNTFLPAQTGDQLGFSYFFEVGGGLELVDRSVIDGLEGVSLRSSVLFGDNVYGWTAGLSLEF